MERGSTEWARRVLYACVTGLAASCTEGKSVEVLAAWADADSLCLIYQYPYFDGVLAIRRTFDEDMYGEAPTDPDRLGQDIADFDIGEPLGTVADSLRQSPDRVHWWGDLDATLPALPSSERLRHVIDRAAAIHEERRAEKASRPRIAHLARRAEGATEWLLVVKDTSESATLTAAEAGLPDDVLMRRFRLATLTRGDHWSFTLRPG